VADAQKERVYEMERQELRGHRAHLLPLKKIRRLVRAACRVYGVPPVTIRVWAVRGFGASYDHDRGAIQLDPKSGRNGLILAHELAHHFTWSKYPKAQDHGPTFAWYYGAILHGWRLVPYEGFRAICRKHGVKVKRPD